MQTLFIFQGRSIFFPIGKASMTDDGEFILPDHDENETNKLEQVYR